jgi:S1-C subfamily serine protease
MSIHNNKKRRVKTYIFFSPRKIIVNQMFIIRISLIVFILSGVYFTNYHYIRYSVTGSSILSHVLADHAALATLIAKNSSDIQGISGDNDDTGNNFTMQRNLLPNLFERVENSVVQITSRVLDINPNVIVNGNSLERQSVRLGSGFVYDNKGHIISNNHVVEGSKTVDVTFVDGNIYSANVIGKDAYSDLSVLQIEPSALYKELLKPLLLANSSKIQVGQEIVSIGNPFGLSGSMTHGIISQINRLLPQPDLGFTIPGTIQIDAAINPGNSGGPLLNLDGKVVGVTTAIYSNTGTFSGIGFAIPSNTVQKIVPQIISQGVFSHSFIGFTGADITPDMAKQLGLNESKGVIVVSLTRGSPADLAGIKSGTNMTSLDGLPSGISSDADIIVGIDNVKVRKMDDIINYIDTKSVGEMVKLKVLRNANIQYINIKLSARPTNPNPLQNATSDSGN